MTTGQCVRTQLCTGGKIRHATCLLTFCGLCCTPGKRWRSLSSQHSDARAVVSKVLSATVSDDHRTVCQDPTLQRWEDKARHLPADVLWPVLHTRKAVAFLIFPAQ